VDYVLEGSIRRESQRIRVTAQLIRVSDQIHLWAENFDRPAQSVLDIQGEVGAAIAAEVRLQLTPQEQDHLRSLPSTNQEAYDNYLRGRYHWARVTYPELLKATDYFRKATKRDSDFTLAYSGLADTLMVMPITSDVEPESVFSEAKSAIATALKLDPNSAEAHTSNATAKFWYDWDFRAAERSARKAISLNRNYALAHLYLAHILSNTGRHEEALSAIEKARLLDPFSLITNTMSGQFLYQAGRVHESIVQFRSTLELENRFWVAHLCLAKALEKLGCYEEALSASEKASHFSGGNSEAVSLAGYIHAISGDMTNAKSHIETLLGQKAKRYVPPYNLALVFAGLRQTEEALHWLAQAFAERDVHIPFLLDHKWDALRSHPRFATFAKLWGR
jgi:tetratricopeptide (TPR) repeat protein